MKLRKQQLDWNHEDAYLLWGDTAGEEEAFVLPDSSVSFLQVIFQGLVYYCLYEFVFFRGHHHHFCSNIAFMAEFDLT